MSLTRPEELVDRVERMIHDVGPLATVSAVGFADQDRERVGRALRLVADARGWAFLDLREVDEPGASEQLARRIGAGKLVLAVRPDTALSPVLNLVRACVHERSEVELASEQRARRPAGQSVVLLLDGCTRWAELQGPISTIPYWDLRP